jgi:hypothetical protein
MKFIKVRDFETSRPNNVETTTWLIINAISVIKMYTQLSTYQHTKNTELHVILMRSLQWNVKNVLKCTFLTLNFRC